MGLAAAAATAVVRPPMGLWPSLAEMTSDYHTAVGENLRVELSPLLHVRLNTQSSLNVMDARTLSLISGEMEVAVASPTVQCVTKAGDAAVSARDATYTLRRLTNGGLVTCITGSITVAERDRAPTPVGPSQQVRFGAGGVSAPIRIDPVVEAGWRQGLLVFRQRALGDVVAEVNRYRRGRIVVLGNELRSRRVDAIFHITRISEALAQVEQLIGLRASHLPGGMAVLHS